MLNNGTEYQHALQEGADPKGNVINLPAYCSSTMPMK